MADFIPVEELASQQAENSDGSITFKRRDFIQSLDSGKREVINRHGRRTEEEISEYITFDNETKESYRKFLGNYVQSLIRIQESDPSLLNDSRREADKKMMELLSKNEEGRTLPSGRPELEVDDAKIEELLHTSNGFALANHALEMYTSKMMLALSLDISHIPPGQRDIQIQDFAFYNGRNQGFFPRVFSGRDTLIERTHALYRGLFDRGGITSVAPDREALLTLQHDTSEAKFIFELTGINVNDFTVNPVTGVVERSRGIADTQAIHEKVEDILGNLSTREEYYYALGMPRNRRNRLDATDSQFIYDLQLTGREEIPTYVNALEKSEFQKEVWEDVMGRLPGDAGYAMTPVIEERVRREHMRVKEKVFMDLVRKQAERQIKEPQDISRSVSSISEKLDRINSGVAGESRKAALQDRNGFLEGRKGELGEEKALFGKFTEGQQRTKDLEDRLIREFGIMPNFDIEATIITELENITSKIEGTVSGGGLHEEIESLIRAKQTSMVEEAKKGLPVGKKQPSIKQKADSIYDESIQNKRNQKAELEKRRESLRGMLADYRTWSREQDQVQQAIIQNAPKELNEIAQAFIDLTSVISFSDLETRSTENLLIDASGALGLPITSEAEKDIVRQRIIQAKTQQKGLRIESLEASPPDQLTDYNDTITPPFAGSGYDITPNDLLSRPEADLISNLQEPTGRYRWPATTPEEQAENRRRLKRAIKEAQNKLRIRHEVLLDEQERSIDEQLKINNRKITETVDDIKNNEGRFLQAAQVIVNPDRRDIIFKNSIDIADNISMYTDDTVITTGNTEYTQEEQSSNYPRGYFELMNFIFDYQQDPQREEKFRNINRALPPQALADVLNQFFEFGLTVGGGGVDELNIENTLSRLGARSNTTPREIQRALSDVIDRVRREADAIII